MPNICHQENPNEVNGGQTIIIPVTGPGNVNHLIICSGAAFVEVVDTGLDGRLIEIDIQIPQEFTQPIGEDTLPAVFLSIGGEFILDNNCAFLVDTVDIHWLDGKAIQISARVRTDTDDVNDTVRFLTYQACIPVTGKASKAPLPNLGCPLSQYQDFSRSMVVSETSTNVANFSRLDILLGTSNNRATVLGIFSGNAILDEMWPSDDGVAMLGTMIIAIDYDIQQSPELRGTSSVTATLSSIANNHYDQNVTLGCDCASIDTGLIGAVVDGTLLVKRVPMIATCLNVLGGAGKTAINRIAYKAHVLMTLQLRILVCGADTVPLNFQDSLTITAGTDWKVKVVLPYGAPLNAKVFLHSNSGLATVQQSIDVPHTRTAFVSPLLQTSTWIPPVHGNPFLVQATITATFGGLTATAYVNVARPPR